MQRQVEAGKASKVDIEQWRKLAFPLPVNMQAGAECRKYTVDSSIMATIILDLQPFNQVNRWVIIFEMPQYRMPS